MYLSLGFAAKETFREKKRKILYGISRKWMQWNNVKTIQNFVKTISSNINCAINLVHFFTLIAQYLKFYYSQWLHEPINKKFRFFREIFTLLFRGIFTLFFSRNRLKRNFATKAIKKFREKFRQTIFLFRWKSYMHLCKRKVTWNYMHQNTLWIYI